MRDNEIILRCLSCILFSWLLHCAVKEQTNFCLATDYASYVLAMWGQIQWHCTCIHRDWSPKFATSLNVRSDSHFEVLNGSISWSVQKLSQKCKKGKKHVTQITSFFYTNHKFFFTNYWKTTEREIFAFCVITFEPIKI